MGQEIFLLMKSKNISKKELMEAINCPKNVNITELKWGRLYPHYDQLIIIADLLDTTVYHLLNAPDAFPPWIDKILDKVDDIISLGIPFIIRRKIRNFKNKKDEKIINQMPLISFNTPTRNRRVYTSNNLKDFCNSPEFEDLVNHDTITQKIILGEKSLEYIENTLQNERKNL